MSGTKVLWGQIIIVGVIVLMAIWSATQWTAWRLGFQPQLGSPRFMLAAWPVYYPPAFFLWKRLFGRVFWTTVMGPKAIEPKAAKSALLRALALIEALDPSRA